MAERRRRSGGNTAEGNRDEGVPPVPVLVEEKPLTQAQIRANTARVLKEAADKAKSAKPAAGKKVAAPKTSSNRGK